MNQDQFALHQATITRTVRRVLWCRTKDLHLIEDFCQEALLLCWKWTQDHGALPEPLGPFVVTVALNLHRSWLRRLGRSRKCQAALRERKQEWSEEDPALLTEKADCFDAILSLLNRLPRLYREITKLRSLDGWTFKEIADKTHLPLNTVKTQFRRAKQLLAPVMVRYANS